MLEPRRTDDRSARNGGAEVEGPDGFPPLFSPDDLDAGYLPLAIYFEPLKRRIGQL